MDLLEEKLSLPTGKLGLIRAATLIGFKDGIQQFPDYEMANPLSSIHMHLEIKEKEPYGSVDENNYKIYFNSLKDRRSPLLYLEETIHWIQLNYNNGLRDKTALAKDDLRLFKKDKFHREPERVLNFIHTVWEFTARVGTLDILQTLPELRDDYNKVLEESNIDINKYKTLDKFDNRVTSHNLGYALGGIYHLSNWEGKVDFRDLMKMKLSQILSHIRKFEDYMKEQFIPEVELGGR